MGTPRRDYAQNRETLLDAAREALAENPDAPLEAIAARAGLSRRTVYGHFPSRDELVRAVVRRGSHRILSAVPRATELAELDPTARIALVATTLWREVAAARVMARVAVRGVLVSEVADVLSPVRAVIRSACADGIADGSLRDDLDAAALGRLVEAACLDVLDEATRSAIGEEEGLSTVVLSALGVAGVDWRRAALAVPAELVPAEPGAEAAADEAVSDEPASDERRTA